AMQNYMSERPQQGGGQRYDRDGLYQWAKGRLGTTLAAKGGGVTANGEASQAGFFAAAHRAIEAEGFTEEFVRTEPRSKLRDKLQDMAAKAMPAGDIDAVDARLDDIFSGARAAEAEDARELADWVKAELGL